MSISPAQQMLPSAGNGGIASGLRSLRELRFAADADRGLKNVRKIRGVIPAAHRAFPPRAGDLRYAAERFGRIEGRQTDKHDRRFSGDIPLGLVQTEAELRHAGKCVACRSRSFLR